jgi:hypothetical protein
VYLLEYLITASDYLTTLYQLLSLCNPGYDEKVVIYGEMEAGIVQWYSSGPRAGWSGVPVLVGAGNIFHHSVQTGSEAHPASYPMGTSGSFLGGKATEE